MREINTLLDEVYTSNERVSRDEIYRRALAFGAHSDLLTALDALPEGEYAQDEVVDALGGAGQVPGELSASGAGRLDRPRGDDDRGDDRGDAGAAAVAGAAGAAGLAGAVGDVGMATGIPATELSDDDLERELAQLHRTREDALRHASDQALGHHNVRMAELEQEYLRRSPERDVDPDRLRSGARDRGHHPGTGGA